MTPYRYGQEGLARVGQVLMFRAARPRRWPAIAVFAVFVGIFCRADSLRGFATAAPNPAARSNEMKQTMTALLFATITTGSASAEQAVQWRLEDGGNGHWYGWGRVSISDASFMQTRDAAIGRGGHLPTVTSAAENDFVFNTIGGGLGLFHLPGGAWQHVNGEPVTYLNWASGQPSSLAQPVFAAYCCHPNDTWGDFTDAEVGNPLEPYTDFRIEWDADCNSDGIVDFGQIRAGDLADANANNIPDCCETGTVCGCPADVILDGVVNGIDLAVIINEWSTDGGKFPRADIDGNGLVDGADLAIVLGSWGPCS